MVRGKTWFRCSCCGHVFEALDIEDNATVFSMPMTCPKCGGKGYAIGPLGFFIRIIKSLFSNQGSIILGICITSFILAVLGLTGISGHEVLFLSVWALTLTLPIFLFSYSTLYRSPLWTLTSITMLIFMCMMLIDRLRGGGYWLPVMDGRMLCHSSLIFSFAGAAVFYFSGWKKELLTAGRKKALVVMAMTYPATSAIYLAGAPLWVSFLTLFLGFGYLFYGFRAMLFWNLFQKKEVNSAYEDFY